MYFILKVHFLINLETCLGHLNVAFSIMTTAHCTQTLIKCFILRLQGVFFSR